MPFPVFLTPSLSFLQSTRPTSADSRTLFPALLSALSSLLLLIPANFAPTLGLCIHYPFADTLFCCCFQGFLCLLHLLLCPSGRCFLTPSMHAYPNTLLYYSENLSLPDMMLFNYLFIFLSLIPLECKFHESVCLA